MLTRLIISQFTIRLLFFSSVFAAQSTADEPVTEELKAETLQSVLGKSAVSRT